MRHSLKALVFVLLLTIGLILSFGVHESWAFSSDSNETTKAKDSQYEMAVQAIKAKRWQPAIELLKKVAARNPAHADAQNYLGYAYRHLGQYGPALKHYKEALSIDAKHRGAHEYIGETYLKLKQLDQAEKHLLALNEICFFGCEEYDELKEKIAAYKQVN